MNGCCHSAGLDCFEAGRTGANQLDWLEARVALRGGRFRVWLDHATAARLPTIWYHMPMSRRQVLVQLDDELLSLLDERAAAAGVSRSEMVRRGVRAVLASDVESKLDQAIAEGYMRLPPPVPDASVERLAVASIEQEPW